MKENRIKEKTKPDLQLMFLQTRTKSTKHIHNRKMLKLLNFLAPTITKLIHVMLTNLSKSSQLRQLPTPTNRHQFRCSVIANSIHTCYLQSTVTSTAENRFGNSISNTAQSCASNPTRLNKGTSMANTSTTAHATTTTPTSTSSSNAPGSTRCLTTCGNRGPASSYGESPSCRNANSSRRNKLLSDKIDILTDLIKKVDIFNETSTNAIQSTEQTSPTRKKSGSTSTSSAPNIAEMSL